jgi:Arc/MetJ-type ribon-helix-helix transcriptional regulator
MTIHLSGRREQLVLALLRAGRFASADELIDEALRLVEQRYQGPGEPADASDRAREQLENLRRLGQKLDAMPTAAVADGLSNRDHDRILYGP